MPAKALKDSAVLRMQTPADDAAWIERYQVVTERLKSKESTVQASGSAEKGVGAGDAARRPKLVEDALGASGFGQSEDDGRESGSTTRVPETVEAREVATSTAT
jgi:hypothetical protein